ncbi:MAG: hypothetical protein ACYCZB_16565 [Acidiphilium sp.]
MARRRRRQALHRLEFRGGPCRLAYRAGDQSLVRRTGRPEPLAAMGEVVQQRVLAADILGIARAIEGDVEIRRRVAPFRDPEGAEMLERIGPRGRDIRVAVEIPGGVEQRHRGDLSGVPPGQEIGEGEFGIGYAIGFAIPEGPEHRRRVAALAVAELDIVNQRIDASHRDVRIGLAVMSRVEIRVRLAADPPSDDAEMEQRIGALGQVRALGGIEPRVEQLAGPDDPDIQGKGGRKIVR